MIPIISAFGTFVFASKPWSLREARPWHRTSPIRRRGRRLRRSFVAAIGIFVRAVSQNRIHASHILKTLTPSLPHLEVSFVVTSHNFQNIATHTFGRLKVIRRVGTSPGGNARWLCVCMCGTQKVIRASELRSGHTQSCGCLAIERATKHGYDRRDNKSPIYDVWRKMIARCTDQKHKSSLSTSNSKHLKSTPHWQIIPQRGSEYMRLPSRSRNRKGQSRFGPLRQLTKRRTSGRGGGDDDSR